MTSFWTFSLSTWFLDSSIQDLAFPIITLIPFNFRIFLQKYSTFKQNLYDKLTLKCLEYHYTKSMIFKYHRFLFAFRFYSVNLCKKLSHFINLDVLAILLAIIFSRLQAASFLIISSLIFLKLDFAVLSIARFYKKRPILLKELYKIDRRFMWSKAAKIAEEAASNPHVQQAATLVVGALAWKVLDVHDTQTQKEIAEQDREAENQRHTEEMNMRQAELDEAKASRYDENQRHNQEMKLRQAELDYNQKNDKNETNFTPHEKLP